MVRTKGKPFSVAVRIIGILTAILVMGAGCGKSEFNSRMSKDSSVTAVMYLNGEAVPKEEYEMLAKEYCNQVYMQYTTEQVNSEDFWEEEIDNVVPYRLLEDIILEKLKENYALKKMAEEFDIADSYTYAELLGAMKEENLLRSDDSEEGETYGLNNFDEATYYKYWYSNLETQVSNVLIQEKINISEKECKTYYTENEEAFAYETGVTILYAEIPYDLGSEEAQEMAIQLKHALENSNSVDELSVMFEKAHIEILNLNSLDTQEGMSGMYSQRWNLASQMEEGEIYGPYEQEGAWGLIKCLKRIENGVADYESVKTRIERYLQQQEAQRVIAQEKENLNLKEGEVSAKEVILSAVSR